MANAAKRLLHESILLDGICCLLMLLTGTRWSSALFNILFSISGWGIFV